MGRDHGALAAALQATNFSGPPTHANGITRLMMTMPNKRTGILDVLELKKVPFEGTRDIPFRTATGDAGPLLDGEVLGRESSAVGRPSRLPASILFVTPNRTTILNSPWLEQPLSC